MPVHRLSARADFPDPRQADPSGLLAWGGDLAPERLLRAYRRGIFPWFNEGDPILWWSPDPRMVLLPGTLHVPRSVARTVRRGAFTVRADTAFAQVIRRCAGAPRPGQDGTWITGDMAAAYDELHRLGHAHSIEAWADGALAGGLYGVSLGGAFFGESMFADQPDASKVAFVVGVEWMARHGIDLVDCQVRTEHLARFGAQEIPRAAFLAQLARALERPGLHGPWRMP